MVTGVLAGFLDLFNWSVFQRRMIFKNHAKTLRSGLWRFPFFFSIVYQGAGATFCLCVWVSVRVVKKKPVAGLATWEQDAMPTERMLALWGRKIWREMNEAEMEWSVAGMESKRNVGDSAM